MAIDPASEAKSAQLAAGYYADMWLNIQLEPIMKVWQGIGGHSNFFVSEEDARVAKGAYVGSEPFRFAETLWRLAQVQPNPKLGYRQGIREYVVDMRIAAAIGVCTANRNLGSGSVIQYYIPFWEKALYSTGREYQFSAKSFP